jgi:hypothetical protein
MNWKGYGRNRSGHNLRYYPGMCLDGPRKPRNTSVRINVSGLIFQPGTFRVEVGTLTTQTPRSVISVTQNRKYDDPLQFLGREVITSRSGRFAWGIYRIGDCAPLRAFRVVISKGRGVNKMVYFPCVLIIILDRKLPVKNDGKIWSSTWRNTFCWKM